MLTVQETRSQFAQRNKSDYWQLDQLIRLIGDLGFSRTFNGIQIYHIQFMHLIIKKPWQLQNYFLPYRR